MRLVCLCILNSRDCWFSYISLIYHEREPCGAELVIAECSFNLFCLIGRLNNRKARMSRVYRVMSEVDNSDRQGGFGILPSYDSPSGTLVDVNVSSTSKMNPISGIGDTILKASTNESSRISAAAPNEITWSESVNLEPGQYVLLLDQNAKEIGKGKVHQAHGHWGGKNLRDSGTCVVDIIDLRIQRLAKVPYPSELTGNSFDQAENKFGSMRVLWDATRLAALQSL